MNYLIFGPYPPPLGGVSVFIKRYSKILLKEGHGIRIVDFGQLSPIQKLSILGKVAFFPDSAIYHLNSFNFYLMVVLILTPFRKKIVFVDHSGRMLEQWNQLQRLIFQRFLDICMECVLVGAGLRTYYEKYGIRLSQNTRIQNAFLPPPQEEESAIRATYHPDMLSFIQSHSPMIVANAFDLVFYQGLDLYGLDMCIDLIADLKPHFPNLGLLIALSLKSDQHYFDDLMQRIQDQALTDNIYFLIDKKEIWPLFKDACLMVRPTAMDGDAVSIREALYVGCPVVASNAICRPEPAITFKSRDRTDFQEKARGVLQNLCPERDRQHGDI